MKQIIPVVAAVALSFALGFLVMFLVRKMRKKSMKRHTYVLLSLGLSLLLCCGALVLYLNMHYTAGETAVRAMKNGSDVSMGVRVSEIDGGIFFDGKGEEGALVFYQGAKVDAEAYAPLMKQIAADGIDCFVLKSPFRMALFDMNAAEKIMRQYDYDIWLVGGHSMGGVAASNFAVSHPNAVKGLLLLASYPTQKIPDSIWTASVYGSNDGVLDRGAYDNAKQYLPEHHVEVVIPGGNHAQFTDYGRQQGDNEASITAEDQQSATGAVVLALLNAVQTGNARF